MNIVQFKPIHTLTPKLWMCEIAAAQAKHRRDVKFCYPRFDLDFKVSNSFWLLSVAVNVDKTFETNILLKMTANEIGFYSIV